MHNRQPITVTITGAGGSIGYILTHMVGSGQVFGHNQPINLRLLGSSRLGSLPGIAMEIQDCAFPLVKGNVVATSDPEVAFKDADVILFAGSAPRKPGMIRKDMLAANVAIFKAQAEVLNKVAKTSVKVLVVSNPTNTLALVLQRYAPNIPKQNFTALTRLDENRAKAQLAVKCNVGVDQVNNCVVWGNHSPTQYPDAYNATIKGQPVTEVADDIWLQETFVPLVQQRGEAVITAKKSTSAISAAQAAADHMRDWYLGTAPGKWVSMGVISDGSYGAPRGVIFSFPCICINGQWDIVRHLPISEFARNKLNATGQDLLTEREEALSICVKKERSPLPLRKISDISFFQMMQEDKRRHFQPSEKTL